MPCRLTIREHYRLASGSSRFIRERQRRSERAQKDTALLDALIGCEPAANLHSVVRPDAQTHVSTSERGGRNRGHVVERRIAEQDGVEAFRYDEGDRGRWFADTVVLQNVVVPLLFTRANLNCPARSKFAAPTDTRPW